jgi:hypothetical protein
MSECVRCEAAVEKRDAVRLPAGIVCEECYRDMGARMP